MIRNDFMMMMISFWNSCSVSAQCCICANVAFWSSSILNIIVDHLSKTTTNKSSVLRQYKLQPNEYLTQKELLDVFALTFLNMVIIAPLICCPMFEYLWDTLHSTPTPSRQRLNIQNDPFDWSREMIRIPIYMIVNEGTFYGVHFLLHSSPFLYRTIHKVHHRFHAPMAMTAPYAHPVEFIFGNVLCIVLGPILTNAHPIMAYIWFTLAMFSTCKGHSGYNILNAATHDAHHEYTNYNFGVLHIGDYLMGTGMPTTNNNKNKDKNKEFSKNKTK